MRILRKKAAMRAISIVLCAGWITATSGCATLAHRNDNYSAHVEHPSPCGEPGQACTWLIGDAVLLVFGIIPGVIAFAVDFGTGAWRHDDLVPADETRVARGGDPAGQRASSEQSQAQPKG